MDQRDENQPSPATNLQKKGTLVLPAGESKEPTPDLGEGGMGALTYFPMPNCKKKGDSPFQLCLRMPEGEKRMLAIRGASA